MTASRRGTWAMFTAAVLANLVMLFWPDPVGGGGVPHLDKVAHAVSFGVVLWTGVRAGLSTTGLAAVLTVHAVASEILQQTVLPGRNGELADVLADLAGVAGAVLALGAASWRHGRSGSRDDGAAARRHTRPG